MYAYTIITSNLIIAYSFLIKKKKNNKNKVKQIVRATFMFNAVLKEIEINEKKKQLNRKHNERDIFFVQTSLMFKT